MISRKGKIDRVSPPDNVINLKINESIKMTTIKLGLTKKPKDTIEKIDTISVSLQGLQNLLYGNFTWLSQLHISFDFFMYI